MSDTPEVPEVEVRAKPKPPPTDGSLPGSELPGDPAPEPTQSDVRRLHPRHAALAAGTPLNRHYRTVDNVRRYVNQRRLPKTQ